MDGTSGLNNGNTTEDTTGRRRTEPSKPSESPSTAKEELPMGYHDADYERLAGSPASHVQNGIKKSTTEGHEALSFHLGCFTMEIIGKLFALRSIAGVAAAPNTSITKLYDEIGRLRVWTFALPRLVVSATSNNLPETIRVGLNDLNMLVDRGNSASFLHICNCQVYLCLM
jgi:hypothetical protein